MGSQTFLLPPPFSGLTSITSGRMLYASSTNVISALTVSTGMQIISGTLKNLESAPLIQRTSFTGIVGFGLSGETNAATLGAAFVTTMNAGYRLELDSDITNPATVLTSTGSSLDVGPGVTLMRTDHGGILSSGDYFSVDGDGSFICDNAVSTGQPFEVTTAGTSVVRCRRMKATGEGANSAIHVQIGTAFIDVRNDVSSDAYDAIDVDSGGYLDLRCQTIYSGDQCIALENVVGNAGTVIAYVDRMYQVPANSHTTVTVDSGTFILVGRSVESNGTLAFNVTNTGASLVDIRQTIGGFTFNGSAELRICNATINGTITVTTNNLVLENCRCITGDTYSITGTNGCTVRIVGKFSSNKVVDTGNITLTYDAHVYP